MNNKIRNEISTAGRKVFCQASILGSLFFLTLKKVLTISFIVEGFTTWVQWLLYHKVAFTETNPLKLFLSDLNLSIGDCIHTTISIYIMVKGAGERKENKKTGCCRLTGHD